MKPIIITGPGHSGTNLALEILRAHDKWTTYPLNGQTEDRDIINLYPKKLPDNYLTKLCTENNAITKKNIKKLIDNNTDLYFLFCLRNPLDTALARVAKYYSIDGTDALRVIRELNFAAQILEYLYENYPNNLKVCSHKFLILNFEKASQNLIEQLDNKEVVVKKGVYTSYKNIRIDDKRKKYKGVLDKRQADLQSNLSSIYSTIWSDPFYTEQAEILYDYFKSNCKEWDYLLSYKLWETTMHNREF